MPPHLIDRLIRKPTPEDKAVDALSLFIPFSRSQDSVMGLSKTEYVTTLREQLEQLGEERTPDGLARVSKAQLNDYSEKIEAIAAKLIFTELSEESSLEANIMESSSPSTSDGDGVYSPRGLRRRFVHQSEDRHPTIVEDSEAPKSVKLDAAGQAHIEKHRKLQEYLTDEMVDLARQLKESSLMMSQSVRNTKKILESTETAVKHGLASTRHANTRAMDVYSQSMKTSCFTWLLILAMTCIFIVVVLLIRVT